MMLLLSLLTSASAGEIQVSAQRPVVLAINGVPAGIASTLVDTRDLKPGTHRIQIRSFVGSLLAEGTFELAENERLQLEYDRYLRRLAVVDRVPLTSPVDLDPPADPSSIPPPAENPPPPIERDAHTAPVADSETASLVITGLSDISGEVRIAGQPVAFSTDTQGFLARGLEPPVVEVHMQDNGRLRYHGAIEITGGSHTACHLHYLKTAWAVDCELSGPELPIHPD